MKKKYKRQYHIIRIFALLNINKYYLNYAYFRVIWLPKNWTSIATSTIMRMNRTASNKFLSLVYRTSFQGCLTLLTKGV